MVAAELVDLHNLGIVAGFAGLQQAMVKPGSNLDEGCQWKPGAGRVDPGVIAGDDALLLQPPYALGDRWR